MSFQGAWSDTHIEVEHHKLFMAVGFILWIYTVRLLLYVHVAQRQTVYNVRMYIYRNSLFMLPSITNYIIIKGSRFRHLTNTAARCIYGYTSFILVLFPNGYTLKKVREKFGHQTVYIEG